MVLLKCYIILLIVSLVSCFQVSNCILQTTQYRLESPPISGAYQIDEAGHPIKVAEKGYTWHIPPSSTAGYAVATEPGNTGVVVPETQGTNLTYGSTILTNGTLLDKPASKPDVQSISGLPGMWLLNGLQ